jgi:hypothetical protein
LFAIVAGPAFAVTQVTTGDPGGSMLCYNCGANNRTQKSGNATDGYIEDNGDGTQDAMMGYTTPSDGSEYSGTISVVVSDADGNLVNNSTQNVSDFGNGTIMYEGQQGLNIPIGGSVSISVSETNSSGRGFTAGWSLRNYRP